MKKTAFAILALLLCISAAGCGAAQPATDLTQPQAAASTAVTTTAPTTRETAAAPTTTEPAPFSPDDVAMTATPNSSCFSEIGYSAAHETLVVRFRGSGQRYSYSGVTASVWEAFRSADSLGRYYNTKIKGFYACEKG